MVEARAASAHGALVVDIDRASAAAAAAAGGIGGGGAAQGCGGAAGAAAAPAARVADCADQISSGVGAGGWSRVAQASFEAGAARRWRQQCRRCKGIGFGLVVVSEGAGATRRCALLRLAAAAASGGGGAEPTLE